MDICSLQFDQVPPALSESVPSACTRSPHVHHCCFLCSHSHSRRCGGNRTILILQQSSCQFSACLRRQFHESLLIHTRIDVDLASVCPYLVPPLAQFFFREIGKCIVVYFLRISETL